MAIIGAVADDLTGATTVGVLLARSGIATAAFFNENCAMSGNCNLNYEAIIVSTNSRGITKEKAMEKVKIATSNLKKMGIRQFSKRIDTTLRGNIGEEIDAMLDELGTDTVAVMVPSMPQSNRIMVGGYSMINGVPLSKTPVSRDVRTPVTDSYVPRLISSQTKRKVSYISLDELLQGRENLKKTMKRFREDGSEILLVDAISLDDVEMIAYAVVELDWNVLAVDPGPFTEKIAIAKGFRKGRIKKTFQMEINNDKFYGTGTVLVVAGSASSVTITQIKKLRNVPETCQVPVKAQLLLPGGDSSDLEIERVSKSVREILGEFNVPRVIILETALSGGVLDLRTESEKYGISPEEAADNINLGLGEITREILDKDGNKIKGLYMTGGDVMVYVCASLGVEGIELIDYVIPQSDLGRFIGSNFNGMTIVGKGGLTGSDEIAINIVNRIFYEEECKKECDSCIK
ncbi:MAG: four-carbon acid sugar kinase family protein [Candidatus Afipia apatlaquensis]|uniref:Four-carbon acid sugar kinase family protein n=1 Tax=Candidatus Afipia apatlaquensis TaxID=2712852 RepID=A0A7C9VJ83_9BRAD|nr:four-carbon acid sugar kinase family protein [Candidatus Afipia apatlaquensis]